MTKRDWLRTIHELDVQKAMVHGARAALRETRLLLDAELTPAGRRVLLTSIEDNKRDAERVNRAMANQVSIGALRGWRRD